MVLMLITFILSYRPTLKAELAARFRATSGKAIGSSGNEAGGAAKAATETSPIAFAVQGPAQARGLVTSLSLACPTFAPRLGRKSGATLADRLGSAGPQSNEQRFDPIQAVAVSPYSGGISRKPERWRNHPIL
jgi:hypothetical protein